MKYRIILILILINIVFINKYYQAEGFKTIRGDVYQKQDGTFAKDEWLSIDTDGDGLYEWYFFNSFGFKVINMNVKGYDLDSQGRWVKDGIVQYDLSKMQLNNQAINNNIITTTNVINNNAISDTNTNNATQNNANIGPNVITNQNNSSGVIIGKNANINKSIEVNINDNNIESNVIVAGTTDSSSKRLLYNSITQKQGTTLYDTKKVNNTGWINVIGMNGNNSYIKTNSGDFNCLAMEVCINNPSDNAIYDLSIYVNNQLLETIDEFDDGPEQIEFFFDPKSNLMIVFNATAEDGKYLSTDNKTLYIRNGRFKNKTNND